MFKDAYQIYKNMDFPGALDYSEECLSLHVEFKTQMILPKLVEARTAATKAVVLDELLEDLDVVGDYNEDEKKSIWSKWMTRAKRRKVEVNPFVTP